MKSENIKDFTKEVFEDFKDTFDVVEMIGVAILLIILGIIILGIISLFFFFPVVMFTILIILITLLAVGAGAVLLFTYFIDKYME